MACVLSLSILVAGANAGIVAYEGDAFPEAVGWTRVGTMDADRSLDNGWFVQSVDLGVWAPLPGGEQDQYNRSLAEFAGTRGFFAEWRVQTDGPRSEIDGVAPASFVLGGERGISFHFTIAADLVRFLRDINDPIIWVDIDPAVPHTYRFEIYGDEFYRFTIDGSEIVSGVPEGFYPTSDSVIAWRAKSWYEPNTTRWDYIRFGTIVHEPATAAMLLAGAGVLVLCDRRRQRRVG